MHKGEPVASLRFQIQGLHLIIKDVYSEALSWILHQMSPALPVCGAREPRMLRSSNSCIWAARI